MFSINATVAVAVQLHRVLRSGRRAAQPAAVSPSVGCAPRTPDLHVHLVPGCTPSPGRTGRRRWWPSRGPPVAWSASALGCAGDLLGGDLAELVGRRGHELLLELRSQLVVGPLGGDEPVERGLLPGVSPAGRELGRGRGDRLGGRDVHHRLVASRGPPQGATSSPRARRGPAGTGPGDLPGIFCPTTAMMISATVMADEKIESAITLKSSSIWATVRPGLSRLAPARGCWPAAAPGRRPARTCRSRTSRPRR